MKRSFVAAAILLAASSSAFATEINFSQPITQLNGQPMVGPDGKPVELTLATVAENVLTSSFQDEPNLKGDEKVKRFVLATKIYDDATAKKNTDISADDITLLKTLIAKAYNPLVTGQAWKMLDPASVPK